MEAGYSHLLPRLRIGNTAPAECLYVGDNFYADVSVRKQPGWCRCCLIRMTYFRMLDVFGSSLSVDLLSVIGQSA